MIAYTGIETVSNLAEEARDPVRSDPARRSGSSRRRLRDLLHAAAGRALGAAGARTIDGELRRRCSRSRRTRAASRTTRSSALVENLGIAGRLLDVLKIYVGVLAATILFIATNAGVIGASRITYSMASYRQLPEVFRRLHPTLQDAVARADRLRRASSRSSSSCRARSTSSGRCTRSARCSRSRRARRGHRAAPAASRDEELAFRARPNLRDRAASTGRCSRSSAASPRRSPGSSSSSRTRRRATWGSAGSRSGFVVYAVYRRRVVKAPLRETRAGAARARAGARARVPEHPRPRRRGQREPRGARRRRAASPPSAARTIVALTRDRGAARAAARRRPARAGGRAPTSCSTRRATIGDLYGVRRRRPRSCARRSAGPGDRGRGGAAQRRDHRHGRAAAGAPRAHARGSSAGRSTTCCATRRAA